MVKLGCYYTTQYDTKVVIHAREQLILNLITIHQRIDPDVVLNKPKLLITRLTNALNGTTLRHNINYLELLLEHRCLNNSQPWLF